MIISESIQGDVYTSRIIKRMWRFYLFKEVFKLLDKRMVRYNIKYSTFITDKY